MSETAFDNQVHLNVMHDAESIIGNALMLCKGLVGAEFIMDKTQFTNAAAGALALLEGSLGEALGAIAEEMSDFGDFYKLYYTGKRKRGECIAVREE